MFKIIVSLLLLLSNPAFSQNQGLTVAPSIVGMSARGQIPGTVTNDNGVAGSVGEFVTSSVLIGSAVSLTTIIPANITSISLTPGDWDVWGMVVTNPNAVTLQSQVAAWVSSSSATIPTPPANGIFASQSTYPAGAPAYAPVNPTRFSINTTTTIFLSGVSVFTTNSNAAYGIIQARRVR